jgi:uncharacterized protein (TIGR02246 family)
MRHALSILCVGLSVLAPGTLKAQAEPPTIPTWAQEQLAAWYKAFNAADAKGVAMLYAADAVLIPPGQAAVRGRAAIEAYHVSVHRDTKFACSGGYLGFRVVANTAVGWGYDECTETPRAGGPAKKTKGQWLSVYEKQSDGQWIIIRDAAESEN